MASVRLLPRDHQWERMSPHLPGKPSDPGRIGIDNGLFVRAFLGSICRRLLVIGTALLSASPGGPRMASGSSFSPRWLTIQTLNIS